MPAPKLGGAEFDPRVEKHKPLLIIKSVDPGCTLELQIENCLTGEVTRLTSTEDPTRDLHNMQEAVLKAFHKVWNDAFY